jgi:hypothetical protein
MLAGASLAAVGYAWASVADEDHLATPEGVGSVGYVGSNLLIYLGSALVLFAIPAMIAVQYERSRKLTLIGGIGLALVMLIQGVSNTFGNVTLFPMLVQNPATIEAANGNPPTILGIFFVVGLIASVVGAIVFGISVLKAKVFPRWTGVLMLVGAVAAPVSSAAPGMLENASAILGSVALVGVGYRLLSPGADVAAPGLVTA